MDLTLLWRLRAPIQWIGRKLIILIGAWTVEPIFSQSHEYHIALRRWQRRWVELVDGVEYKLNTRSSFDAHSDTQQSIWLRNTGKSVVDEIQFCVEGKLGNFSYQVPLAAYRLRPGCTVQLTLLGLPLQDLAVDADRIISTYEALHIYPVRIERNRLAEIYSTDGLAWHPSYDDFLNGRWRRWNGRLYNLTAISNARRDYFLHLAHSLCGRHGYFGFEAGSLLAQAFRTRRYSSVPSVLLFALVSRDSVLSAILWLRMLLRIEKIAFETDAAMTTATEHVQHKGDSARPVRVVPI